MIRLTDKENESYNYQTNCLIFQKKITANDDKGF